MKQIQILALAVLIAVGAPLLMPSAGSVSEPAVEAAEGSLHSDRVRPVSPLPLQEDAWETARAYLEAQSSGDVAQAARLLLVTEEAPAVVWAIPGQLTGFSLHTYEPGATPDALTVFFWAELDVGRGQVERKPMLLELRRVDGAWWVL